MCREIQNTQSLVKTRDCNRRLDIIDKTITGFIGNINDQVKTLNQVGSAVQKSTDDVSYLKNDLQQWTSSVLEAVKVSLTSAMTNLTANHKNMIGEQVFITQSIAKSVEDMIRTAENKHLETKIQLPTEDPYTKKTFDQISSMQGVIRQLQSSVNQQNQELVVMKSHNEEVIKLLSKLTFDQLNKQGSQESRNRVRIEPNPHETPPHMKDSFRTDSRREYLAPPEEIQYYTPLNGRGEVWTQSTPIAREKSSNKENLNWKTQATSGSNVPVKQIPTKTPVVRIPGKCDTCGSTDTGHDYRLCRRKSKNINLLDQEDDEVLSPTGEELELIFGDDHDSLYDDGEYRVIQEVSAETTNISKLEDTFQVMDISCLEEHAAKAPVFIKRRSVEKQLGSPFLTTMCNSWKMHMLIDSGACNSLITPRVLNNIWPFWEKEVRTRQKREYFSASGSLQSIGEITLPIQFLHETSPCILMIDFIVIMNARNIEIVLGADMMNEYGMSISIRSSIYSYT
ncbi:uncharacterized protein MELLADRAFT_62972 [Melampsora larici-populina 98AG31]|uniref:Uncharacterized protein n=1 Tax=Melampsora larici-populina (strain 98AG31 / pathotype 3-4-7) TaxID=747676 RepID=F4RKT8_MELLP|nr:uncharacterized protein MELLADRAFT_62972 [Melampsora larici-populina 98AG31]EGG06980.1 hypothetical protein MELLADRAFT_62972 [Melampsora larici-populina 98AG31]